MAGQYLREQYCYDLLAIQLENTWRRLVAEWHFENPFTPAELAARQSPDLFEAYGTTLLFVVKKASHLVAIRIGDGDIISVSRDGFVQPLFPAKNSSAATYSLAHPNSYLHAELTTRCVKNNALPLVFACSDGVADGCASRADFSAIAEQLYLMLRTHGIERVRKELPLLLKRVNGTTDQTGSGDDASLALAYCGDIK